MAGGIKAVIATQFDATGVNKAIKEFNKLGGSLKGIAGSLGIGLGLGAITSGLNEAAKAASNDAKGQILLAQQLRNTADATDSQIASVENAISKMSIASAVADDQLRPAMASLVRATGDVTKAQDLLSLSLDVSAATGKDLNAVSLAIGKAVTGQTTALFRMIPGLKGSSDFMAKLRDETQGMAEAAGAADPYAQITVIFDELQEQIGTYLLPAMKDLSKYLQSEEFAGAIDSAFKGFDKIFSAVDVLTKSIPGLGQVFDGLGSSLANGNWVKFIPILGTYIDLLSKLNPKAATGGSVLDQYKYNTGQYGKKTTGGKKGPTDAQLKAAADAAKKAAAERAAIAKAIAAANAEMAKAAEEAMATYREQMVAYSEQVTAVNDYKNSLLGLTDAIKPLAFEEKVLGRFAQASADSFDAIAANIKENSKMFYDGGKSLLAYVAKERVAIEQLAAQRDALAEKYSLAKAVKTDIEAAIKSFGNITNLLDKQSTQVTETMTTVVDGIQLTRSKLVEQTTTSNIVANFQAILDKTKAFAVSLKKLRELGLDQNLYKQIVDAGVDAGGQTAEAILAGGSDTVRSLNSIFKDLNAVGADIGEQTAQVMYGAGIDLTNGLLEGIKSKDQELIDQAKAMAKAFSDAFNMELSLNLASPTAPVMPGFGIDATDFIPGYGRVSSTGTNPSGGNVYNIKVEAGLIANKQEIPSMIVDALGTYTKQSGAGGLTRVLGL